ncbi:MULTISPECIES: DUF3947 family protein [Bacillus cereus group]|uniref:DUF3947 family protein n=1 Tax=Bacillus cereus group TaxID=86661 RepID=UPI000BF0F82B|nr:MULTISPECIES: DUF3947 family protein [Bacillus cereus group]MBJ8112496.1 DUF3947 family protein [Bacillus cereus group sp. N6]PEJ97081.1 alpha/beta hydrolase [Bacillus wiedmannii]PEL74622.1 alpha/beta hydrolase [Bacillus wiedmannii]PEM31074.1 alpha/beta hydrolase [Bacillus wiedmannii]PGD61700.1 alpha/beta hydrolase [Bacillus wiedmannii]
MFYSYFATQAGMRPAYGTSITFSGAQSTVQAVQQALQMQQQMQQQMQMQQQGIQPYYSSMEYFYPVHQITPYGSSFLTIPYGTVFNL